MKIQFYVLAATTLLFLTGCEGFKSSALSEITDSSGTAPTPPPTPTATPPPTPTATPVPTATPAPTATPTPTATPRPSATPTPPPTPTATPPPTPTATPMPAGTLSFQAGVYLPGTPSMRYFALHMTDFTRDGNADILLLVHDDAGEWNHYWRGNGAGQFTHLDNTQYGSGVGNLDNNDARGSLWSYLIDFNNDGNLDWFWDDVSPGSLRMNDGSGHFTEVAINDVSSTHNRSRGFWDYNHDGILDVVDNSGKIWNGAYILSGQTSTPIDIPLADFHCDPVEFYVVPLCASAYGENLDMIHIQTITRADFDGDGDKDVVVDIGASFSNDNEVRLYRNDNGTLVRVGALPNHMAGVYANYSNIITADFNNDGKIDIAVAGALMTQYEIFLNQGNFTFASAYQFNVGPGDGRSGIAAADYDNDGKIDIAVISGEGVQVYKNTSH